MTSPIVPRPGSAAIRVYVSLPLLQQGWLRLQRCLQAKACQVGCGSPPPAFACAPWLRLLVAQRMQARSLPSLPSRQQGRRPGHGRRGQAGGGRAQTVTVLSCQQQSSRSCSLLTAFHIVQHLKLVPLQPRDAAAEAAVVARLGTAAPVVPPLCRQLSGTAQPSLGPQIQTSATALARRPCYGLQQTARSPPCSGCWSMAQT